MRLLTRYVVREVSQIFVVTLTALTSLIVLVLSVSEAIKQGFGAAQIAQLLPCVVPTALIFAVPGSMLFAVSSVYGRMASSNEIVAVKSAGLSPMVLLWPTLFLSVVVSLATVWLNDLAMSWTPMAVARVAFNSLEDLAYSTLRTQKSYSMGSFHVTVMRVEGRRLIHPYFSFVDGGKRSTVKADSAELSCKPGSAKLTVTCRNAEIMVGDDNYAYLPNTDWEREIDIRPPSDLSPKQLPLRRISQSIAEQKKNVLAIEQGMIAHSAFQMMCGDFAALKGPYWNDSVRQAQTARNNLLRTQLEPPRRWAAGFSCTAFALVGATMAIRRRNSDALTSFFLCFGPILLVYYPFLAYALDRAKDGAISPYAVWMANAIVLLWGLWNLRKVVRY